jgi:hypothetical protein
MLITTSLKFHNAKRGKNAFITFKVTVHIAQLHLAQSTSRSRQIIFALKNRLGKSCEQGQKAGYFFSPPPREEPLETNL